MDKTLSQAEVDALLQAIKTGNVATEEAEHVIQPAEEVKVVAYDFRKPHLMSSDQLRGFQLIHETFAKCLTTGLVTNLKTQIEAKVVAIDTITYGEFTMSLLSPTYVAILGTSPNVGDIGMEINLPIILCMIDVLLGGSSTHVHEGRELTMIEQSIGATIVYFILAELHSAWEGTANLNFKVRSAESNPEYIQITTKESAVLLATFDLRIGETTGTLNLCYPFEVLQPLLARLSARMTGRKEKTARSDHERLSMLKVMGAVPLTVRAEIGSSTILASQLGALKQGDLLCLDTRIDTPANVFVGNEKCFRASLCTSRGKIALRLLDRVFEPPEGTAEPPPTDGQ